MYHIHSYSKQPKKMKKRVRFNDRIEIHHIDGDDSCRLNRRVQQSKHMIKNMPMTMFLAIYLPLDLYKKFAMEVHPRSKDKNKYKVIKDLEAKFGRPFEYSDVHWLLEGVSVPDNSFYALARSYQHSEGKIQAFYKTVIAGNKDFGNKRKQHHKQSIEKQEPRPRGRVLTTEGSGSASNRGRSPRRKLRQMPSTSTLPLAARKHEDRCDAQVPKYPHGGRERGHGISSEIPHQCHEPGKPAYSLSTVDKDSSGVPIPIYSHGGRRIRNEISGINIEFPHHSHEPGPALSFVEPSCVRTQGKIAGSVQTSSYSRQLRSTSTPPLAVRKHEDRCDAQVPKYPHDGRETGRGGISSKIPHQCCDPGKPEYSLSTVDKDITGVPMSKYSHGGRGHGTRHGDSGISIEFPHHSHEPGRARSLSIVDQTSVRAQGKIAQTSSYVTTSAPVQSLALTLSSTLKGLTLGEAKNRSSAHSSPSLPQSSRPHLFSTALFRAN